MSRSLHDLKVAVVASEQPWQGASDTTMTHWQILWSIRGVQPPVLGGIRLSLLRLRRQGGDSSIRRIDDHRRPVVKVSLD